MKSTTYLDYAAATPVSPEVLEVMLPYMTARFYNPSAIYLAAKGVAQDIAEARKRVAGHLGARPTEIIFTAGGTEANNLAIRGVMEAYPDANVVISSVEHDSVLAPARLFDYQDAPVKPTGLLDLESLEKLIDDQTVLVSVIYANNEIGTIQPIRQVSAIISEIRKKRRSKGNALPLYLHTDACQAASYLDLHVSRLGVDMMTLNGGKIHGPKQSGVLYVNGSVILKPQIAGGGQERGLRSGTENVAGIMGFAKALDIAQGMRGPETERLKNLQSLFIELLKNKVPQAVINGTTKHRLPNNIHITIPGTDNERLMFELDEQGVICAVGSACSASKAEPSHVLKAIGLSDAEARASLRFSMGRQTKEEDVKRTVDVLSSVL